MRGLVLFALVTGLCLHTAAGAGEAEVSNTLDEFHAAAARGDSEAYFAVMTDAVVFLGTDATERWQGQAFRKFVLEHFGEGRGWTYTPGARHIDMAPGGKWAFFDELLQHDRLGQCRGSGVLVREGDAWKIAQYNLSVPVPNAIVLDVAGQIRALPAPNP